jgi:serine/threonine protein kinase
MWPQRYFHETLMAHKRTSGRLGSSFLFCLPGTPRYGQSVRLKRKYHPTDVCSYPPFFEDDQPALFEAIKTGRYNFDPRDWGQISPGAKDLVSKILVVDPLKRYTSAEILAHPWMQADAATLPNVMLASTQQQLRQFNAKRKLKRAINGVRTAYRLKKMISKSSRAGTEASSADLTSDEASCANLAP